MLQSCLLRLRNNLSVRSWFAITNVNKRIHSCGVCSKYRSLISDRDGKASPGLSSKYQVMTDNNSHVIGHTADEIDYNYYEAPYHSVSDEFDGINLQRGKTGVFDIEDLVQVLRRENCQDIFVVTVPSHFRYCDYICVVTAKSKRHIKAVAEFVRKVYKKKCFFRTDQIPRIEGKESDEWMAIDLGNIALHIFSAQSRVTYDLESLWSVGHEYEEPMNKTEFSDILQNYNNFLKELKPLHVTKTSTSPLEATQFNPKSRKSAVKQSQKCSESYTIMHQRNPFLWPEPERELDNKQRDQRAALNKMNTISGDKNIVEMYPMKEK